MRYAPHGFEPGDAAPFPQAERVGNSGFVSLGKAEADPAVAVDLPWHGDEFDAGT